MKADPFQIGDVLKDSRRFVVPIYQRTYAWKVKPQLETFFDQAEGKAHDRLKGNPTFPHYMGALLVIPRGAFAFGRMQVLDVVDGQQRLTTFQIFLAALREVARSIGESQTADLLASLLLNAESPQMQDPRSERYKLHPTPYDRKLYRDLIDLNLEDLRRNYSSAFYQNGKLKDSAPLPLRAWEFFRLQSEEFVMTSGTESRSERLTAISAAVLEDFRVIVITLDERDDAQVIFETLNSHGEPLAAMDLVRNDVFHRAARAEEDVEALMERRWSVFEEPFWKQIGTRGRIKKPRIDFFLSDTLGAETGKEILLNELYAHYKGFVRERNFPHVDAELETLLRHVPTFRKLVEPTGAGTLAKIARTLNVFDVSTAYPLIFVVESSNASEAEKEAIYDLIISYVVRRALCGLSPKNYNNTFLRIASLMRADGISRATFENAFAATRGDTVRFPGNSELRKQMRERRQYGNLLQPRLRYVLGELEHASRDKFDEAATLPDDLTIEHVLPDSWPEHWPLPDGLTCPANRRTGMSEGQLAMIEIRDVMKDTLGNLTLLTGARNPNLGNLGFETKRDALRRSLLKLNHEIAEVIQWNEASILIRADRLADLALQLWPGIPETVEGLPYEEARDGPNWDTYELRLATAPDFTHRWPDGNSEDFTQVHEGTALLDGRSYRVKLGTTVRESAGRSRRRYLVVIDAYPTVEFVASDDSLTGNLASILKSRTAEQIPNDGPPPPEYAGLRLAPYRTIVNGPGAPNGLAVLCESSDFHTMVRHALIRTTYRHAANV